MLKKNVNIKYIILGAIFLGILLHYEILLDIVLILLLLLSSYSIGVNFNIDATYWCKFFVQLGVGLGIIGITIYFALLFGIGSTSIYLLILTTPIIINLKKIIFTTKSVIKNCTNIILQSNKEQFFMFFIEIIFMIYLAIGSAPISSYDSLTKHLPLTMYAVRNGEWYTNILESTVYGESMLLHYTYSVLFASFGAYKALVLFNVVLFFIIFFLLALFCRTLYKKTNIWILAGMYFSIPIFFERATIMSLEVTSLFFLFCGIIPLMSLNKEKIWNNIYSVAFLFGCSLFTKLTNAYTILVIGIIALIYLFIHYFTSIKDVKKLVIKIGISAISLVGSFICSIIVMWYRNGNPLLPFYNGIFKSPYYKITNFIDPFNNSPLGLNINSLIKMVFNTSKNIEMQDGALGIYLLFFFLIPCAALFYKKKKYAIWSSMTFVMFPLSCLFTYNLRYSISIFILFLCLIIIAVSFFINKSLPKWNKVLYLIMGVVFILPNVIYLYKYMDIPRKLEKNVEITSSDNDSILREIPRGKMVLSVNDTFKGTYDGFYSTDTWYNTYTVSKLNSMELSWEDYIRSFDYIIYNKKMPTNHEYINLLMEGADKDNSLISKFAETNTHIAFNVKSDKITTNTILDTMFDEPKISKTSAPVTERFDNTEDFYILTHDIENSSSNNVEMRFQINWYDKDDRFLSTDITTYNALPGRNVYTSNIISNNTNANYGIVFITTNNDEEIKVYNYKLVSYEKYNYNDEETRKLYDRELLD